MALDTLGGLKTALAAWSTYSDVTTQLDDFVMWAHQEICRRLRANVMLASADITIDAETEAQPAGFLAMKRLYLNTNPIRRLATASAETVMDLSAQLVTLEYPTHVAVEGVNLRFAPRFSTTTTGKALYYAEPDALVADADTNAVLTKYPYLYLFGALEALHAFKEDAEMAAGFGGKFGSLLDDINRRDAGDTMSGPLQSSPYPGGII